MTLLYALDPEFLCIRWRCLQQVNFSTSQLSQPNSPLARIAVHWFCLANTFGLARKRNKIIDTKPLTSWKSNQNCTRVIRCTNLSQDFLVSVFQFNENFVPESQLPLALCSNMPTCIEIFLRAFQSYTVVGSSTFSLIILRRKKNAADHNCPFLRMLYPWPLRYDNAVEMSSASVLFETNPHLDSNTTVHGHYGCSSYPMLTVI